MRSTRSIYLALACLSLTLHLLLAFFCLSVLQTACVLPTSSSSIPRTDTQHNQPVFHSSSSSAASSPRKVPTSGQKDVRDKSNSNLFLHKGEDSLTEAAERGKKVIGAGGRIQKVKGRSELEALFKHPLYNLPRPELQDDDWLLRVKTAGDAKDTQSEEEEWEGAINSDSKW